MAHGIVALNLFTDVLTMDRASNAVYRQTMCRQARFISFGLFHRGSSIFAEPLFYEL